jgi:hypothetical protein
VGVPILSPLEGDTDTILDVRSALDPSQAGLLSRAADVTQALYAHACDCVNGTLCSSVLASKVGCAHVCPITVRGRWRC